MKPHARHAGRLCRRYAHGAVLNHQHPAGNRPHVVGGVQEEIGFRLSPGYHRGIENPHVVGIETGNCEGVADPLRPARGGDAEGNGQPGQHVLDPLDGLQGRRNGAHQRGHELCFEAWGQRMSGGAPERVLDHAEARSEIACEDIVGRRLQSVLGQQPRQAPSRQNLAVDEHAVAVEDDEVERISAAHEAPSGRCPRVCAERDKVQGAY